jgi:branched-chain amino acid transport system ATP-binding protein
VLTIESLDVSIESVRILRGVGLSVGQGQLAGLIGRNGAGKTTLMRTIVGILTPRAGSIVFDGKPLAGVPAHARARLGIGYMPEDRRIIPPLTVEENVMLPAWAAGADGRARLARIYEMIPEIKALRERKGLQLSGGQQKLVALARALMSGTKLLLLDEPFEGVAPVLARRLIEVVALLRNEGLSVVLSESDLSHSRELLDVVFTIDRGTVTRAHGGPPRPPPREGASP